MFCKYCGQELPEQVTVCPTCQRPVDEQTPPPYTAPRQQDPYASGQKSRIAAGVLGVTLGSLGVHNFYLGYTGRGLAQVLLTVLSCGAFAPITAIWGLVEGIMILTGSVQCDATGQPLKD